MMTTSNGNIFRVTGPLLGKFTGHRWKPAQRPVTRSFDVFFDLCLNKRLSKQSWGWWFEMLSRPLGRHCNAFLEIQTQSCPRSRSHIEAWRKWLTLCWQHFSELTHWGLDKMWPFWKKNIAGSHCYYFSIGSGNDLSETMFTNFHNVPPGFK